MMKSMTMLMSARIQIDGDGSSLGPSSGKMGDIFSMDSNCDKCGCRKDDVLETNVRRKPEDESVGSLTTITMPTMSTMSTATMTMDASEPTPFTLSADDVQKMLDIQLPSEGVPSLHMTASEIKESFSTLTPNHPHPNATLKSMDGPVPQMTQQLSAPLMSPNQRKKGLRPNMKRWISDKGPDDETEDEIDLDAHDLDEGSNSDLDVGMPPMATSNSVPLHGGIGMTGSPKRKKSHLVRVESETVWEREEMDGLKEEMEQQLFDLANQASIKSEAVSVPVSPAKGSNIEQWQHEDIEKETEEMMKQISHLAKQATMTDGQDSNDENL